jgi:hypothetical protein
MHTDFKYFHWAMPKKGCELYGLYDVFDNQLLLLTYDFEVVWQLKNIIKSKIILEIVDFSNQISAVYEKIDNSIVETWGLNSTPTHLFQDIRSLSDSYRDKTRYRQDVLIRDFEIVKNNVEFDTFKEDLQHQLFFFHYCLFQANNQYQYSNDSFFYKHLLKSAELGESYQDCLDKFIDISYINQQDPDSVILQFMNAENLMYE